MWALVKKLKYDHLSHEYPLVVFLFGIALFYLQITLHWWQPEHYSATLLGFLALLTLVFGFALASFQFYHFMQRSLQESNDVKVRLLLFAMALVVLVGLFSSLKPTHLVQESDFINYHWLLSKQPWFTGTWSPLSAHPYEFLHVVPQLGLSFLWVAVPLFNKIPQFLFFLFLLLRLWALPLLLGLRRPYISGLLIVVCFLSFRGVAIQVGMAMLDLVNCYFLISVVSHWLWFQQNAIQKKYCGWYTVFFGGALAGYLGHKSFGIILTLAILFLFYIAGKFILRARTKMSPQQYYVHVVLLVLAVVWLPSLLRAAYYTGDPFYPVFPALSERYCNDAHLDASVNCAALVKRSHGLRSTVNNYGYGHTIKSYLQAFCLVGFAEKGSVNNRFDYPLGFMWLFLWFVVLVGIMNERVRRVSFFFGFVGFGYFTIWFLGSQQSRWLYPVVMLLSVYVGVLYSKNYLPPNCCLPWRKIHTSIAASGLALALSAFLVVNALRTIRSQWNTLACFGVRCLESNPRYWADVHETCENGQLVFIHDTHERGYIPCGVVLTDSSGDKIGK